MTSSLTISDISSSDSVSDKEDKWLQNQMSMFDQDQVDWGGYPPPPKFNLPPPPLHPDMVTSSCDSDVTSFNLQRQLDTCDINFVSALNLLFYQQNFVKSKAQNSPKNNSEK